jgi:hypothetical protein
MTTELRYQLTPEWRRKWELLMACVYWVGLSAITIATVLIGAHEDLDLSPWWVGLIGGVGAVSCMAWIMMSQYQLRRMTEAIDELREYSETHRRLSQQSK